MAKNIHIFKASEVEAGKKGWTVDLSPEEFVSKDFYWTWNTKKEAEYFWELVKVDGMNPDAAANEVDARFARSFNPYCKSR